MSLARTPGDRPPRDRSSVVRTPGSATAVAVSSEGRRSAFSFILLLLIGAVVTGVGGLMGVAHTFDGSALGVASGAVWVVTVPALVAVIVAARRPTWGLAVGAGAGVVALARLVTDLTLLTSPNSAIRPELFYEMSDRAQPFSTASGAYVVVLGDVIMVAAGVLAARRLSGSLSFRAERIFDAEPLEPQSSESGPELLAEALESTDATQAADPFLSGPEDGPSRNNWLIFAGFVGVLALLSGSLGLPYTGGYLASRYLPAELDLWGIVAALVVAVIGTIAVLAAAVLPRQIALALLGGTALGAATPFLTALAVRLTSAPVHVNPTVGLGLAGAVVLAAAGLLARVGLITDDYAPASPSAIRTLNTVGAVLSLLTGVAGLAAWRLPQLRYNGGPDPSLPSGYPISAPLSLPYLIAGVIPLIAGILWLLPPLARAGRAVAAVGWTALIFAVAQSLYVLGEVTTSASVPLADGSPIKQPNWSTGSGLWFGIGGLVLGLAVVAISASASRQATDESALIPDDESLAKARSLGVIVAGVLTVVSVIALALPTYRTSTGQSPNLLVGFQVNAWGVLALAIGMIVAAWAAGRAVRPSQAIGYALIGGAVLIARLVIPASLRAQDGFSVGPGVYAGYVAVLAFVVAAGLFGRSVGRIRMVEPTSPTSSPKGREKAARPAARQGRASAPASPVGRPGGKGRGPATQRGAKGR